MCRVRGIGVAERVSTSTVGAERLEPLLVLDAEPLLLVDDDQAQVLERRRPSGRSGACRSGCRPPPAAVRFRTSLISDLGRNRLTTSIVNGNSAIRAEKLRWCCSARIVVGTRTATCLPASTALNAARMATSVLP